MAIPKMIKIRQSFNSEHIHGFESAVENQIVSSGIQIKKGSSVAIAVGSRGISNINRIVKTVVSCVKESGAFPFIVPAMGSHGGATAEGQKKVLEGYGITEQYIGAPIKSSMEVVELPRGDLKHRVYMDKNAYEADATIIINRIKPHTDFHGKHESGLMKMCAIGLGKHKQALEIHKYGARGLKEMIVPTARQVLKYGNIIMGIGIVENAYDQVKIIKVLKPSEIEDEEMKLLNIARESMPCLPTDKIDVLIIDEIGKDISGTGADTNIIGRIRIRGENEPQKPDITNIVMTDLTEESHGNGLGVGLADFITKRLFEKIDLKVTYENVLTSNFLQRGNIPIIADTDKQAVEYALRTCGPIEPEKARVIRIKNTLKLDEIYVSESVLDEIKHNSNIRILGEFRDMFNGDKLADF